MSTKQQIFFFSLVKGRHVAPVLSIYARPMVGFLSIVHGFQPPELTVTYDR